MNKRILHSLVSLCFLLLLNKTNAQSEVDFRLIPTDCEYGMTAFLAGAGPDYTASYDWGDGSTSLANWAYVNHVYSQPGIYTVIAIHDGFTYVDEVSIEDCSCPEAFESVTFSAQCNQLEIRVDTYLWSSNDYSVVWDFGNGQSYTSNTNPVGYQTYSNEGTYLVSAFFTGPGCEDGVTLTTEVEVEFCEGECYPYIEYFYDETTCNYFAYNETGSDDTEWFIDGEFFAEGSFLDNFSLSPGYHELCCIVQPNDYCPFGQTECFDINTPECGQSCDFVLFTNEIDCQMVEFEISSANEVSEITWDFGFGDPFIGSTYEIFTYPADGEYQVCYSYVCNYDDSFQQNCEWIYVEGCQDEECSELAIDNVDCLEASFTYSGEFNGIFHQWTVLQDGLLIETYEANGTTVIDFPNAGLYQVGVSDALNCEGEIEPYYIEIEVESCEATCGCEIAENLVENGDFEEAGFQNSGFPFDCSCVNGSVCVGNEARDKCDNTLWLEDFWDHTYGTEEGSFLIVDGGIGTVWFDELEVEAGQLYNFSFWTAREISDNATNFSFQNLSVVINQNELYNFTTAAAPGQEWVQYCTEFYAQDSGTINISLVQNQGYGFDDWGLDDVEFGSCGELNPSCPEVVVSETGECGAYEFEYFGEITGGSYCWEIWNDNYFSTYFDQQTTDFSFLEPGTYYVTVTNAVLCPGQELVIEVVVPDCGNGFCIEAVGGVQNGCTTAILTVYASFEIEEIHWLLDGEIIIAGNNFEYDFGSSDIQTIEIDYIPGINCNDVLEGWEIPIFMDTSWCQEDCYLEISAEQADSGNYVFHAIPSDPEAVISWLVNGEYHIGNPLTFEFSEPGVHEVCAFYETVDCPYGVEDCIEVTVLPSDCPEITYELTDDCNVVNFEYTGYIDGSFYCWDAIGEEFYITYFDGSTTTVVFPGAGTYLVGVTNALLCPDQIDSFIEIIIPDCGGDCVASILVNNQDCNDIILEFPESASQIFIDYGDGTYEVEPNDMLLDHSYELLGEYVLCTEYFDIECQEWVGDCITIFLECDSPCDFEIEVESLGNNTYIFTAVGLYEGAWNSWTVEGQNYYNQNPFTYTFEEEGEYEVCFDMETEDCSSSNNCFPVVVTDENECEEVTISLEGLLGGNESWLQTLECVLSLDGDPLWEEIISLSSEQNLEELNFCLPEGCYEFSVSNADPLILSSLLLLVEAIDGTEIEYEFDILEGSASIQFGIGVQCDTSIESQTISEITFYPVPASDHVFISNSENLEHLEVIDAQGRIVFRSNEKNLNSISVSQWANGMYTIRYLEKENWHSSRIQVFK